MEFTVQILYNSKRKPTHVFAGDVVQAHHAACPGNKTCGQVKIFKNEMRLNIGSPHRCGSPASDGPQYRHRRVCRCRMVLQDTYATSRATVGRGNPSPWKTGTP